MPVFSDNNLNLRKSAGSAGNVLFYYIRHLNNYNMKKSILLLTSAVVFMLLWSCTSKQEKMENRLKAFISSYEEKDNSSLQGNVTHIMGCQYNRK